MIQYAIFDDGIEGRQTLKLEGSVTIRHARALFTLVAESLQDGEPLAVETGELEDVDTSILQLLCSLRRTVSAVTFAPAFRTISEGTGSQPVAA